MSKSKTVPRPKKPRKPHRDYPLSPHANGQWSKRIRLKLYYFGPWADPQGALERYLAVKDDLLAGRAPKTTPTPTTGRTVRDLVNAFLYAKELRRDAGEIKPRTWDDYNAVCGKVVKFFGDTPIEAIQPDDFRRFRAQLAKGRGPESLANDVNRTRILFKFAFDEGLIDKPIRYGQSFPKPTRVTLRKARQARGELMFSPEQLRAMIEAASRPLRAMILLGINGGLGNHDVATLPVSALDLDLGWLDYPRPKTAVPRRIPLWPETVLALQQVLAQRPKPHDARLKGRVFVTSHGGTWERNGQDNPVSKEMAKLLKRLGFHRDGLGFYSLRRTFETIGGESRDQIAVDAIMGHTPASDDMAAVYRQRISDDRLVGVVSFVRDWAFNNSASGESTSPAVVKPAFDAPRVTF